MVVDGKDEIELQDSLDKIHRICNKYHSGNAAVEDAYKAIKEEVDSDE